MPVGIAFENLSKQFGDSKKAVENLSLKLYENQITALLGHNGAGKVRRDPCVVLVFIGRCFPSLKFADNHHQRSHRYLSANERHSQHLRARHHRRLQRNTKERGSMPARRHSLRLHDRARASAVLRSSQRKHERQRIEQRHQRVSTKLSEQFARSAPCPRSLQIVE